MMLFIVESVLLNRQEEIEELCADQVIILYNVQKQKTIKQLSKEKSIKVNECHIHVFKESLKRNIFNKSLKLLTKRELEILTLVSEGFLQKEIAGKCEISLKTVQNHLSEIRRKLQVDSTYHAITIAIRLQLI